MSTFSDKATRGSLPRWITHLNRPWIVLSFFLALYLVQALPFLSYRWVTDESWYAGPGYSIASGHGLRDPAMGPNDIENHLDARPPGTALVIATFFKLFGVSQITARLGSVLAGALVVALVFWLSRSFLGPTGAFIATLLIATDNLLILTARTARPEALTVAMVFLSLLFVKRYKDTFALTWAFLTGLTMAMGTMFHITLLGYIFSLFILLITIGTTRKTSWWNPALLYIIGYTAGLIPFASWILIAPRGREGFRAEFLSRAVQTPLLLRLVQEQRRYSDLIGLNMLHGYGLESIPVRLPIPLLFLLASFVVWKYRRKWFWLEMLLLAPSVLWLIYTVNKSSRYLVLLAPLSALAIGAAVAATTDHPRLRRILTAAACLAALAQVGANVFLLRAARSANYSRVTAQLQTAIPSGATAYGTITFWLALHNRNYISYERTTPQMAAELYGARYFITGDRMMTNPEMFGDKDFNTKLGTEMAEIQNRSDFLTSVYDKYYGNLMIYRLRSR